MHAGVHAALSPVQFSMTAAGVAFSGEQGKHPLQRCTGYDATLLQQHLHQGMKRRLHPSANPCMVDEGLYIPAAADLIRAWEMGAQSRWRLQKSERAPPQYGGAHYTATTPQ